MILIVSCGLILTACELSGAPAGATAGPAPSPPGTSLPASKSSGAASAEKVAALRAALNHTIDATVYRMALDFTLGTTGSGAYKEQTFLKFDGEVNGAANHVTYNGGAFNDMLGGGDRIEVISVDGKTYLKGSALFGTADPEKWYVLAGSAISKPPFNLADMLAQSGADLSGASVAPATESLDGQSCETWQVDISGGTGALVDIASSDETRGDFSALDKAEGRFSRCADNYIHKLTWTVLAHNSQNTNARGSVLVVVHLFDFEAHSLAISAPPDATELR
jgi:hypothetical protein